MLVLALLAGAAIFARYNYDFYAVDPHLFSPAEVVFQNLDTGRPHAFGKVEPAVLARYVPDGLHPNDEGHVILAEEIRKFLEGLPL